MGAEAWRRHSAVGLAQWFFWGITIGSLSVRSTPAADKGRAVRRHGAKSDGLFSLGCLGITEAPWDAYES